MNLYELTYVLRPDLEEDALNSAQERVSARVSDTGGEILKSEGWGRRRLAYPIDRLREGLYFTSILRLPGPELRGLENQLKLAPEILRFLLIRQEERNINMAGSLLPASHRPATAVAPEAAPAVESGEAEAEAPAEGADTTEAVVEPVADGDTGAETGPEPDVVKAASEEPEAVTTETEPQAMEIESVAAEAEPVEAEAEPVAEPEPARVETEAVAPDELEASPQKEPELEIEASADKNGTPVKQDEG